MLTSLWFCKTRAAVSTRATAGNFPGSHCALRGALQRALACCVPVDFLSVTHLCTEMCEGLWGPLCTLQASAEPSVCRTASWAVRVCLYLQTAALLTFFLLLLCVTWNSRYPINLVFMLIC